jgi:hypothetical protein
MNDVYQNLSQRYNELETEVCEALRTEVQNSLVQSKHMNTPVIKVNVFDYKELAVINDRLTFLDSNGYHYDLYSECSLEDLIDILVQL